MLPFIGNEWTFGDSNPGPTGYEPVALTNWANGPQKGKPMIGLEPITCWLQISCSANWATSAHSLISLSRVTPTGIEPVLPPWKGDVLTAWPWSQLFKTPQVGLEPTTLRLTAECSTDWAIEDYLRFYIPSKLHTFPKGSSSRFARCDEQPKNNSFFSNSTIFM